jgi:hypothetical protein
LAVFYWFLVPIRVDKGEFIDTVYTHWLFAGDNTDEQLKLARDWQSRRDQPFLVLQLGENSSITSLNPELRDPIGALPENLWVSFDFYKGIEIVRLVNLSDKEWIRDLNVYWVLEFLGFQETQNVKRMTMTANQEWSAYRNNRKNWKTFQKSTYIEPSLKAIALHPMQVLTLSLPSSI